MSIKYSIAIGTGGPFQPLQRLLATTIASSLLGQIQAETRELEWLIEKGEELLNCEELAEGLGDGAVSVRSAKMTGVSDIETFRMHHVQWTDWRSSETMRLLQWVEKRIY